MATHISPPLNSLREPARRLVATPTHPASPWVEIADLRQLADLIPAWDNLAAHAIEPNPFYESWNLRHALATLDAAAVQVIVVWRRASPEHAPEMCGLFPIETTSTFRGLPIRAVRMWHHLFCFLCTPLVRANSEVPCLQVLFAWLDAAGLGVLEFPLVPASGPFSRALIDATERADLLMWIPMSVNRASIEIAPSVDGAGYLSTTLTGKARQEWQRQRRRLAELGRLETRALGDDDDVGEWIGWFLELEASGWKGRERTALASSPATTAFFSDVARDAFARRQLRMLGLFLDDRPIALKCDFVCGSGAFGFKMAFDERLAKYSPGVQLELDNIVALHHERRVHWVDSCTEPHQGSIARLWKDRRTLQHILISAGSRRGDFAIGMIPLVRSVRRALRRRKPGLATSLRPD